MSFAYDLDGAVQACAYLMKLSGKRRMQYLKLLKLLYWADRESLRDSGFPITGDEPYAMQYGPVLSTIYECIVPRPGLKRIPADIKRSNEFLERDGYDVKLKSDPGTGKLSRYDRRILRMVHDHHKDVDGFEMSHLSHDFPEWKKNWYSPDRKSRRSMHISLEDRLTALGMSSRIKAIREQAAEDKAYHDAFGV